MRYTNKFPKTPYSTMLREVEKCSGLRILVPGPRRHQYVGEYWADRPSSAAAAHGRQHYCAAAPVRPVPDKYACQATNKGTIG